MWRRRGKTGAARPGMTSGAGSAFSGPGAGLGAVPAQVPVIVNVTGVRLPEVTVTVLAPAVGAAVSTVCA